MTNIFIILFWNRNDRVETSRAYFLKFALEYEPEEAVNRGWIAQGEQPLKANITMYIAIEYMRVYFEYFLKTFFF